MRVKISVASLRQLFHPCTADFIASTCGARCCEKSSGGIMVTIHPDEIATFRALGAAIVDGFVQPASNGKCPFKTAANLCSIHERKPFGCSASPFTLSAGDVLIIRNRYRALKCFRAPGSLPAYRAHEWSLRRIFDDTVADEIIRLLDAGATENFEAEMGWREYSMMKDNDAAKHREAAA